MARDPEHRLVVSVVPGARTIENTAAWVTDFPRRTEGRAMNRRTSDDSPVSETALRNADGATVTPPRTGRPGRPQAPSQAPPPGRTDATVTPRREKGRVVAVGPRVVFGGVAAVRAAGRVSRVSRAINTAFVERENATDRHRNGRTARKTDRFSNDGRFHEAVIDLTLDVANFYWPVRTLTITDERGRRGRRSPAIAAGLTDHVWTMREWMTFPTVQRC